MGACFGSVNIELISAAFKLKLTIANTVRRHENRGSVLDVLFSQSLRALRCAEKLTLQLFVPNAIYVVPDLRTNAYTQAVIFQQISRGSFPIELLDHGFV